MKKLLSLETAGDIIFKIEKEHKCVIKKDEKVENKNPKEAMVVTDEVTTTEAGVVSMNEPNHGVMSPLSAPGSMNTVVAMNSPAPSLISSLPFNPSTPLKLPYQSMSCINNKEIKMASGQKILIVVGDLAQEKV